MIFEVDSLGEIMNQIKMYLLNGLTCRRVEDKQDAWLTVASHHAATVYRARATGLCVLHVVAALKLSTL